MGTQSAVGMEDAAVDCGDRGAGLCVYDEGCARYSELDFEVAGMFMSCHVSSSDGDDCADINDSLLLMLQYRLMLFGTSVTKLLAILLLLPLAITASLWHWTSASSLSPSSRSSSHAASLRLHPAP